MALKTGVITQTAFEANGNHIPQRVIMLTPRLIIDYFSINNDWRVHTSPGSFSGI
jgi:hypothetical protein